MSQKPFEDFIQYEPMSGCWIWQGTWDKKGYGLRFLYKTERGICRWAQAHRVSWEMHRGPIPDGMVIDHKCRNRACVNPEHLRVVTPTQNTLENSNSWACRNASKTHCKHCGRPYSEIRIVPYLVPKGYRQCADCANAMSMERHWKNREKKLEQMRVYRAKRKAAAATTT